MAATLVAAAALACAPSALGHAGEAHVDVTPARVEAGEALSVHGAGFGDEARVTLTLVGARRIPLPTRATTDAEGSFTAAVAVPAGVPARGYRVLASAGGEIAASPAFAVLPSSGAGEGGRRDEEEPLLAPIPPPAPAADAPVAAAPEGDDSSGLAIGLAAGGAALVLAVGTVTLVLRRRRAAHPPRDAVE